MSTAHNIPASNATKGPSTALRLSLAVNALVAAVALAIKFGEAATTADPQFPTVFGRVTNELCYFTIQSNIIVLGVCVALAWRPQRWRWIAGVPRLVGLVCITVTAVVYYALLAGDEHFVGIAKVGDVLAHAVSPLLYVGTWLVVGPRAHLVRRHAGQMLLFPVFWVALTLVRGAIIHVYPYDFVDVRVNGYVSVIVTIVALTAAAGGLAAAAVWVDRRMTTVATRSFRRRPAHRAAALAVVRRGSPADQ
jgi:hypothetical protein